MYIDFHAKYCCPCQILMEFECSRQIFSKNAQTQTFMEICPVRAEFIHADGQADMAILRVAFRNFANTPKTATLFSLFSAIPISFIILS